MQQNLQQNYQYFAEVLTTKSIPSEEGEGHGITVTDKKLKKNYFQKTQEAFN